MASASSSSSSQSWGSYFWNSLPKRAAQSGISSGFLAAGETLLICSLTPEPVVTAVQYVATGILVSGALVVCHSLGDKTMTYSAALNEPLIKGMQIWLKAQDFFNSAQPRQESPVASSSSGPSSPLPSLSPSISAINESLSLSVASSSSSSSSSPPGSLEGSEPLPLPAASSSSSSSSSPPSRLDGSRSPASANPSLASLPKKVGAAVFQTLKGATRVLEFCGAREEAVAAGLALGGTTYVISEDEEISAIAAGVSAAVVGVVLTVQASSQATLPPAPASSDSGSSGKQEEKS